MKKIFLKILCSLGFILEIFNKTRRLKYLGNKAVETESTKPGVMVTSYWSMLKVRVKIGILEI